MQTTTLAMRKAKQGPGRGAPKAVVVGGSAGGFESLKAMLRDLPPSFPAPILVVLHLDPHVPSNAAALLAGHTRLEVRKAVAGERPKPGMVYLSEPDRHMELHQGRLALTKSPRVNFSRPSVDRLFASAAKAYGPGLTAVVLSGTAFDGREGVQRVKAAGGTCLAEDPATATQSGMPEAAVATGCVDAVLPADRLGSYLLHAASGLRVRLTAAAWKKAEQLLRTKCGVHFQGYRPETLRRRMEACIAATGMESAARYVELLQRDPAELERLRSALLIKVSSFLRDSPQWTTLQEECLAPLAEREGKHEIRMWSAGCATGEEAYSLAMLTLASAKRPLHLKVFATDIDDPALAVGRHGRYPKAAVDEVSPALARRFFKAEGDTKRIVPQVRRHVIFGRHDLVRDPPLASMDVVACRNVLIYLEPGQRQLVLDRLTSALRVGGVLFLGKAEGTPMPGPGFVRLAPGVPIYRRTAVQNGHDASGARGANMKGRHGRAVRLTASPKMPTEPVLFAVDTALRVTIWNPAAEAAFAIPSSAAIGTALAAVIPGPSAPVERLAQAAIKDGKRTRIPVIVLHNGASLVLQGIPLPDGAGLMFMGKAPKAPPVPPPLGHKARPYDANGWRDSMEIQQTLNEELQSRNEELETVNEELQSLNDEIQVQGDEARHATMFLSAILDSGPDVFVGCDGKGMVSYWGKPAVRQFHLSSAQALGKDLLELVPQLDFPQLRKLLRNGKSKATKSPKTVNASNGLRVMVFPALDANGRSHGSLLRILAGRKSA